MRINYSGQKLHSWQYKTPHDVQNKIVRIIGIGNSGGEMAVEVGRVAKQISIRIFLFYDTTH